MQIKNFKDLTVWQKSMDLVVEVYQLVKEMPKEETHGLSNQMRRSAVSIPSNIAEGYYRYSDKELQKYLYIARGSSAELETQLIVVARLNLVSDITVQKTIAKCEEVEKMLNAFITRISKDTQY
ncbi:MAG: four helix bundle protein [Ruminococcaceae bacterium]|nr:four helix bundle protein [Oscillospiraceae bacterium]